MTQAELMEYRQLKRDRAETERTIKEIEMSADGLCAAIIDGLPHGSSRRAGLEGIVIKYEEQTAHYLGRLSEIVDKLERIENAVNSLPHDLRRVCWLYYCSGNRKKTFYQIANIVKYSERQVRRQHEKALLILKDVR